MSQAAKVRLENLDIKPYVITKLKMAGIESVFDLAISIPHQLIDIGGGMLTGTDEHIALELVTKAKKALVDSGLLYKDFSTAQDILDRSLLRCTTGSARLDSFLKGGIETQAMVDSIIALHRAEFTGRGTLAERQQRLNIMLHKLSRLAEVHNIAVVVTNQVQSQPDDFSAGRDGLRATGGNVMGHGSTYRIFLRKAGRLISRRRQSCQSRMLPFVWDLLRPSFLLIQLISHSTEYG
jgi:RecA/RadA recombinase